MKKNKTYSWSSTQVDEDLALLENMIFLVQLDKLERCTSAVTLLLGKLVPFVETTFSVLYWLSIWEYPPRCDKPYLLLNGHDCGLSVKALPAASTVL